MSEKKTHFGRAGEYFAMSELLLRGWNVAVPVVDVGDDVFIIDDNDKTTWRLQVKSAQCVEDTSVDRHVYNGEFTLSRRQISTLQQVELFYLLLLRIETAWRFLVIPRLALFTVREKFVQGSRAGKRGRPPLADTVAKTDALGLNVTLQGDDVTGWDTDLSQYLDQWPEVLAPVMGGPGSVAR